MNTLKLRRILIIFPVSALIIYATMASFFTFNLWPKYDLEEDIFLWGMRGMILFFDALFVLGIWFMVNTIRRYLSYQIIFGEGHVEESRNLKPFSKRVKIAYDQIRSVSYEWPGVLVISSSGKDQIKIAPNSMEGGKQKVLDLIKMYLPDEVVRGNLSEKIENIKPFEKRYLYVSYVIMAFFFVALFGRELLSLFSISWNIYGNWGSRYVAGFQVESQDSTWVVTRDLFSDVAEVFHYGENVTRWKLPDPETSIDYFNVIILPDSQGLPTVINHAGKIYILNSQGEWTRMGFPEGYAPWLFGDDYASFQNDAWFILHGENDDNVLAHFRVGSNKIDLMQPPDFAKEGEYEPYRLSILPDGTLLVLAGKHESTIFIYKNGEWQDETYAVNDYDQMIIKDFTMDANGHFYLLYIGFLTDKNIVERVDAGDVLVTELPAPKDKIGYQHLEVDRNGRLWIDSGYETKVVVLKPVWGGIAEEIVSYTENNSSFSGDSDVGLRLLSNGQIWSADSKLVWIDSNLEELPQPLPAWVSIFENRGYQFVIYLIFMLFLFLWNYYIKSVGRKYYSNEPEK